MFSDPIFVFFTLIACLGLLYCSSILIENLGSVSRKNGAFFIAFLLISSFITLIIKRLQTSLKANKHQMNNSIILLRNWRNSYSRILMT